MNADRDYYAILGVLPSVDGAVLQAVYRALAKKHHPDITGNGNTEAFLAIQEAYEVLSDPAKRARYDDLRRQQDDKAGRYDQEASSDGPGTQAPMDEDWVIIEEYEPEVAAAEKMLRELSASLGDLFRNVMLTERKFGDADKTAARLRAEFLQTYFGSNKLFQDFAIELLAPPYDKKRREAARELNKVVRALGNPSDPLGVIKRIRQKFELVSASARRRPDLPNDSRGWRIVIAQAEKRGWEFMGGGLTGVGFRHKATDKAVKVNTPLEAWVTLDLDEPQHRR